MRARGWFLAVLVGGLVLLVGGCSSDSGSSGASGAKSDSPSPSPVSSGSAPKSPSAAPSTTSAAPSGTSAEPSATSAASSSSAPPPCITKDLRVTVPPGDGAAGSVYYQVVLRNISSGACRTGGFGGVSMVDTRGRRIGAPADRTQRGKVVPVVLAPDGRAHATLQVVQAGNYSAGRCHPTPAAGLRVYPPNQTVSRVVRLELQGCRLTRTHLMSLSPYQPRR